MNSDSRKEILRKKGNDKEIFKFSPYFTTKTKNFSARDILSPQHFISDFFSVVFLVLFLRGFCVLSRVFSIHFFLHIASQFRYPPGFLMGTKPHYRFPRMHMMLLETRQIPPNNYLGLK